MKPYRLVVCLALLSGAFAVHAQESLASIFTNADMSGTSARRMSIIYIQCHGLGYGDLSCYGQTNYQTPNLDRLAAEGMRFTNFRPDGADFTAALGALVTGKKTGTAGAPTIATRLQAGGYHTGLVGEWTVDGQPWTDGFDEFAGFLDAEAGRNYFADTVWRFDPRNNYDQTTHQWVDLKPGDAHNGGPEMLYPNTGGKQGQYLPELFFNVICNFVRVNVPDQFNKYKPFFLMVDLPAPRSAAAGADVFPVPSDAPFSDAPWPQAAKNRAALITRLDGGIGRLFNQFRQLGISNNVAIFFSSSEVPEKFHDPKMDFLAPNGTAVAGDDGGSAALPMIVWCPQAIPAGQVSLFKWSGVDFAPTALQLSYIKPVNDLDGISIVPVLQGKKGPEVDAPPIK
jgi:arylsulfatase A